MRSDSYLRIAAIFATGLAATGCPTPLPPSPGERPARVTVNRPPTLEPLYAEDDGRRVRAVPPGATVTVRARASDPDGDALGFRWTLGAASGELLEVEARQVRWRVSGSSGSKVLRLRVDDVRGASTSAQLRLDGDTTVSFAGRVLTTDGEPLDSVRVDVNGATVWTDEAGDFALRVADTEAPRFILSMDKPGHGLVSRVYDHPVDDGRWVLARGTTELADPTQPILVQDAAAAASCVGTPSSRIDWSQHPRQRVARIFDLDGSPFQGPVPESVRRAIAELSAANPCAAGISIGIPANSLVDDQGQPPSGPVRVSVTTVDLRSPDAMPGDYTARSGDSVAVMQSYGAGTVTVTADGGPLRLAEGARATLTVPVDPIRFDRETTPGPSIPLLHYGESDGVWRAEGEARLDPSRRAYVAELTHFSAFNTDILKAAQSCVRIDSGAITGDYLLEATLPTAAGPDVRSYTIDNTPETVHSLYNLPSDEWIVLVPIRETSPGDFEPLGTFVVNTGPPQEPTDPNRPAYPYDACRSRVSLFEVPAEVHIVTQAPAGIAGDGPLPLVFFALTDPAGTDTYPPGADERVLCGLFDTGSTSLAVNGGVANRFSCVPDGSTDAAELQLSAGTTVNVRLAGLSARRADGTVPMAAPGTPDGAEVEVAGVTGGPVPADATRLGGAVMQSVVAYIDNATILTDAGTGATGPDIEFFEADDAAIPAADITLDLGRDGVFYVIPGLTFENGGEQSQPFGGADPGHFVLDTGTTLTIIGDRVATDLGLSSGDGFLCYGGMNGFTIDAAVMAGTGGSYTIEDFEVCWDQGEIAYPTRFDAVLGSDLFLQVPIVFDSQNETLGLIVPPTP